MDSRALTVFCGLAEVDDSGELLVELEDKKLSVPGCCFSLGPAGGSGWELVRNLIGGLALFEAGSFTSVEGPVTSAALGGMLACTAPDEFIFLARPWISSCGSGLGA